MNLIKTRKQNGWMGMIFQRNAKQKELNYGKIKRKMNGDPFLWRF
nr:hypothetical protein [Evansella caseinilytica]